LYKEVQEAREPRVPRELKEPQVSPKGLQEEQELKGLKVPQELPVLFLVPLLILRQLVHKEQLGLLVYLKGLQEEQELKGLKAPQDLQAQFKVFKEHKDHRVLKARKDQTHQLLDQQVHRVQLA
jgi:hypothetical protein